MFRKRIKFGIRMQMTVGLIAVFIVSGLFLFFITDQQIGRSREEQISRELENLRENTEIYVRQLLILNDANNDEPSFRQIAEDIVQELNSSRRYEMAVYTKDGELLSDSFDSSGMEELQSRGQTQDFQEALAGNTAFTMIHPSTEELEVWFSMPVIVAEKTIGLIRYRMDYSSLWQQGQQMENMILRTAAVVFAASFLMILLILNRILLPISRLTKVSRLMTLDLEQNQIKTELLAGFADSKRRDEVGELSRDYSRMLNKTGEYIQKINEDRNQILSLLDSRQEFYNNVTHELKTPLTTIQGYAQLIEADDGEDRELVQKGISHILHESTRLHKMVLQLLEMADRETRMEFLPVDMGRLLSSVTEAMEIRANRYGDHILLKLDQELIVEGQEERLRQILINLIDNAVKYGNTGTKIIICGKRQSDGVKISVTNWGKVMNTDELQHIFEPFYRADKGYSREQGSAGLGLSICRKIMKEHQGMIWAESKADGEITFFLYFPDKAAQEEKRRTENEKL